MSSSDDLFPSRHRLSKLIGVDDMSDVYHIEGVVLGHSVAIKMVRADLAGDENFPTGFRHETRNSALLNYPSIVSIYDTGEMDSPMRCMPFIVMELIQGEIPRDLICRGERLDPKKAALTMASVCDTLTVSRHAGTIHRDTRPANIMLTNASGMRVMDSGVARTLGDSITMTQTVAVPDTAQRLSPE